MPRPIAFVQAEDDAKRKTTAGLTETRGATSKAMLRKRGRMRKRGTLVDATLQAAPRSRSGPAASFRCESIPQALR